LAPVVLRDYCSCQVMRDQHFAVFDAVSYVLLGMILATVSYVSLMLSRLDWADAGFACHNWM